MRNLLLSVLLLSFSVGAIAQETKGKASSKTKKESKKKGTPAKWDFGGQASLAVAQTGSRNWVPGGDRFTISGNGFLNLYAKMTKGKCHWDSWGDFNYGMQNSKAFGLIKNDDKLELNSRYSYSLDKKDRFRISAWANFRTQFTEGYSYDGEQRSRISAFLAPGVISFSPGIAYLPAKGAYIHVSPYTARWILVPNRPYELGPKYGVEPSNEVRIEGGAQVSLGYTGKLYKNVEYRGRADVFSDYLHDHPTNLDFYITNMFYVNISKHLAVVYNFDFVYDDNTRIFGYTGEKAQAQLKSIFGLGLNVKF
jgi:hypothetical protein